MSTSNTGLVRHHFYVLRTETAPKQCSLPTISAAYYNVEGSGYQHLRFFSECEFCT